MSQTLTTPMPAVSQERDGDLALVERYLAGDIAAFDELMIRYQRHIFRLCYRFVENRDDALDLTQDVFIKAFEKLPTFRRQSAFKTWLYRIAINHFINHVKKNRHEFVDANEYFGSTLPTVQAELEERERRDHFRRLIRRLPPKQKAILELRVNEELSYEEIAGICGRSISTIKTSVFFALQKLRKLLREEAAREHRLAASQRRNAQHNPSS